MLLTKEAALTKWCPFAREAVVGNPEPTYNRLYDEDGGSIELSHCFADTCACWEWVEGEHAAGKGPFVWTKGRCGLAHKGGGED